MPKLFVYGTLKRGQSRNGYLTRHGARFLGDARTAPGYRLLHPHATDYPCLVEEADGISVAGELWGVPENTLVDILDPVEGAPDLFVRRPILLETGEQVQAYLIRVRPLQARDVGTSW